MDKKRDYFILRIEKDYEQKMKKLKEKFGRSMKELTEQMIDYFNAVGIDPNTRDESVSKELQSLRNTFISFIRNQEKTKLNPLVNQFNEAMQLMINFYKNEALTKKDLERFKFSNVVPSTIENVTEKPSHEPNEMQEEEEFVTGRAKKLVNEMMKHFKTSNTFGQAKMVIDKNVVDHYKTEIEKL